MGLDSLFRRKPKAEKPAQANKVDHSDKIALAALAAVGAGVGAGAGVIEQNQSGPHFPANLVAAPSGQVAMGNSTDKPAPIMVKSTEMAPTVAETPSTVTPSEQKHVVEQSAEKRYVIAADKVDGYEKPIVIKADQVEQ